MTTAAATTASGGSSGVANETSVPVLRVMRLQSPELHELSSGTLLASADSCLLQGALCLPNSLSVYVGEAFTAYLGVLNASHNHMIRRLTVHAQLQSPSHRWQLPSKLDQEGNLTGGMDIAPEQGVDAIVSHAIEEPGQHILRVEVGYMTADGGTKTFRKFYRFQVMHPLLFRDWTVRCGDSRCFVSVEIACNKKINESGATSDDSPGPLAIQDVRFAPAEGLSATQLGRPNPVRSKQSILKSAVDLLDEANIVGVGGCCRFMFQVDASSKEAILRGIAAGDLLGKLVVTWKKAMGETGIVSSPAITCPKCQPILPDPSTGQIPNNSNFVVHRSGLSVDVAAAAATRGARPDRNSIGVQMPVTVEPIDPPTRMVLNVPSEVQFLVVNHSDQTMPLQFQFRLENMMSGLAVCGSSFQSIGEVPPFGGSAVVTARLLPLEAGLLRVQGCMIVDLASGREMPQPALFHVFVDRESPQTPELAESVTEASPEPLLQ